MGNKCLGDSLSKTADHKVLHYGASECGKEFVLRITICQISFTPQALSMLFFSPFPYPQQRPSVKKSKEGKLLLNDIMQIVDRLMMSQVNIENGYKNI